MLYRTIPLLFLCITAWYLPETVRAQEELESSVEIDWPAGSITVRAKSFIRSADSPPGGRSFAVERLEQAGVIQRRLPQILQDFLFNLPLDSYRLVGDVEELTKIAGEIERIGTAGAIRLQESLSKDFSAFQGIFRYELFPDIISPFIEHRFPVNPRRILTYEPTAEFSGVIIYAKEQLPVHGEEGTAYVQPGFFPEIYDLSMNPVYSPGMVDPQYIRKWGVVGYVFSSEDSGIVERVGLTPLRTMAYRVFGKNRTDISIPNQDAAKLLYRRENQRLLREGRIIIICNPPSY